MVRRRLGSLAVCVLVAGCVSACGGAGGQSGAEFIVPDTVDLPDATPVFVPPPVRPLAAQTLMPATVPSPTTAATTPVDPTALDPVATDAALDHAVAVHPIAEAAPVAVPELPVGLRQATFQFSGDTLVHSPLVNRARANADGDGYDFAPMYERVAPILSSADLAICHLESPVVPEGEALSTFPQYAIPPEIATALASAGYDRCSTASNHSIDRGTGSIDATVSALEAAGLTQAGMARTPEESVASLVETNGITVAHLSYTYGFNGAHLPKHEPWRSNLIDVPTIIAAAQDARARGAEIVVLNLHWGSEGSSAISEYQQRIASAITAAGVVDLIVGEHAHVIQPIEQVNGTWVVYGMGNFLSNMPTGPFPPSSQDGIIVSVSISEQADGTFAVDRPVVIPTWVDRGNGFVIRPVLADLADPDVSAAVKDLLYQSLQRTGAVVGGFVGG